jgi:hypothetical protein
MESIGLARLITALYQRNGGHGNGVEGSGRAMMGTERTG